MRERQKIFSLPDITKMQVNAKVHESQIDKIQQGPEGQDPGRRLRRPRALRHGHGRGAPAGCHQLLQLRHQGLHHPHPDRRPAAGPAARHERRGGDPGRSQGQGAGGSHPGDSRVPGQGPHRGQDAQRIRAPGRGSGSQQRAVRGGHQGSDGGNGGGAEPGVAHDRGGEARASRRSKGANKKDWGGLAKGKDEAGAPGAEGAKGCPIAAPARAWRPRRASRAIPPPRARRRPRAVAKGAGGGGAFMAKVQEHSRGRSGEDEEREPRRASARS